ncbi:MAG: DUF3786 domain-containing protein [Chloroflexi bacterium]|nr:DUF3786 domain-containing protein [Chloroflexota bacterium]
MDTRFLPPPRETYQASYDKACREARSLDPARAATLAGVDFAAKGEGAGVATITLFGRRYQVSFPDLTIAEVGVEKKPSLVTQILLLHHLLQADGSPLAGEWVAFRYMPGGRLYEAAFEGRAPRELARVFGQDKEAFVRVARSLDGHVLRFGDASFSFRPLPRLALAVLLWLGDEEMPAAAQILFDAAAGHYLPTEDLTAVGGMLGGLLLRAKG